MHPFTEKRCQACEKEGAPLSRGTLETLLKELPHWKLDPEGTAITRLLTFKNYYHTMAFVNALAYLSHCENHHPDLEVSYNKCLVRYTTHAVKGLSENDFICAAKVDALLENAL